MIAFDVSFSILFGLRKRHFLILADYSPQKMQKLIFRIGQKQNMANSGVTNFFLIPDKILVTYLGLNFWPIFLCYDSSVDRALDFRSEGPDDGGHF